MTTGTSLRAGWVVLGAMSLPLIALAIDVNGVGVVLPEISSGLHLTSTETTWVMNASPLAFAAFLVVIGRVADRVGSRPLLLSGIAGFGLASAVCAAAPDGTVLIAGRVLQGIASALCFTTSLAVVDASFDDARRPTAIGIWGAVMGVGGALGPVVAGALTTGVGWRAFFAVNVALCLAVVPVLARVAPPSSTGSGEPLRPGASLALVIALALVMFGIQETGERGWGSAVVLAPLVAGIVGLGALVARERRAPQPFVVRSVTRAPRFLLANTVGTCGNWAFGAVVVFIAAWLQTVAGLSALGAGAAFLVFSGMFAVAGTASGRVSSRLGAACGLGIGAALGAAGTAAMVFLPPGGGLAVALIGLAVAGFGLGLVFDVSSTASLEGVPTAAAAEAAGVIQTTRLVGLVLGIAVSTWLQLQVSATAGGGHHPAFTAGVQAVMGLAAAVCVVGVGFAVMLRRRAPDGYAIRGMSRA